MDSPFLYRKQHPSSSQRRSSPIQRVETSCMTPKPKVVSIPVHFVGSETARSKSARKIQKVFRGFLVRKSVKKIVSIKKEVEEIDELRISNNELIRKEAKERLRINEMLMASLLKLDSISGIDAGVRDLRKFVIKKAIGLQEKLDAFAADAHDEDIKEMIVSTSPFIQKDDDVDHEEHRDKEQHMADKKSSTAGGEGGEQKMNEKMIGMMNDLIPRNEIQTPLLTSLTHRVAQLDKAFLCDQLRKSYKKKKTNP